MSDYSDIIPDGGMDPRHKLEDSMYRHTVAQRNAAWREIEQWQKRYEALLRLMTDQTALQANPPLKLLANAESFNAGKAMAFNEAKYTIGIDTSDGFHTVTVFRMAPGQPTTMVASQRLPEVRP